MSGGSSQSKRHVRVERGIFRRGTADGRVRHEFNYTDSGGRTRWETVATLKEAREGRAAKIAALARGERVVVSRATFGELAEPWFESKSARLRPRTRGLYRDALDLVLLPRFGPINVRRIDADAVARLVRDLEREGLHAVDPARRVRPLGPSSIENYLKPLNGIMTLAVRRALIPVNPVSLLTTDERPRETETEPPYEWSDAEIDALLAASQMLAARPVAKYDYTDVLRYTARLAFRLGEALGLCWEDFDKDDPCICVRRQWLDSREYGPTKTPAGVRRIPLPMDLRDDLIALRLASPFSGDKDPIFASSTGAPLQHRNVSARGFNRARDSAGLPHHLTFHDLRHAAVSRLIAAGLDPVTVAKLVGHDDPNITLRRYAHVFDRVRRDEAVRAALA
jgi:integrase